MQLCSPVLPSGQAQAKICSLGQSALGLHKRLPVSPMSSQEPGSGEALPAVLQRSKRPQSRSSPRQPASQKPPRQRSSSPLVPGGRPQRHFGASPSRARRSRHGMAGVARLRALPTPSEQLRPPPAAPSAFALPALVLVVVAVARPVAAVAGLRGRRSRRSRSRRCRSRGRTARRSKCHPRCRRRDFRSLSQVPLGASSSRHAASGA